MLGLLRIFLVCRFVMAVAVWLWLVEAPGLAVRMDLHGAGRDPLRLVQVV